MNEPNDWLDSELPWVDNTNHTIEDLLETLAQVETWEARWKRPAPISSMPVITHQVFYDLLKRVVRLEERIGE